MAQSSDRRTGSTSNGSKAGGTSATTFCVVLSALLHAVLLIGLVFMPDLAPAKKIIPSVVSVSLVSLPAGGDALSPAPAASAELRASQKLQTPTQATGSKVPVSAPKPKRKTSLKRKTFKSEKVVKSAVDQLEKKLDESRPPSLEKALERLKRDVADGSQNPRGTTSPVQGGAAGSGPRLSSGEISDGVRIYQAEIIYQIQRNWAFSEHVAGAEKDLEALIGIRIAPDGRITSTWFDQRSGNRHLDESAHRAIMKANPLPPLPRGVFEGEYEVGLRFGPEGIKR